MKDQEITPLYCDRASFGEAVQSFAGFSRCCLVKFRDLLEIARGLPVMPYALSLIGKYCRRRSLKRNPTLSRFKQRFTSLPLQISIHISLSADGVCETHLACPPDLVIRLLYTGCGYLKIAVHPISLYLIDTRFFHPLVCLINEKEFQKPVYFLYSPGQAGLFSLFLDSLGGLRIFQV